MNERTMDRIGERGYNNFGSEMIIVEYRGALDMDVCFPQYNWTAKNVRYDHFKNGNVKCPYEPRTYGVGYFGEGKYKSSENGKDTRVYTTWRSMIRRCYDEKNRGKRSLTYKDCKVCDEWLNFQNFAEWYDNNYYEIEGEKMHLDKDILFKGNKIYSPDTCVFVSERINTLFTKRDKSRGKSVIGTSLRNGKYKVECHMLNPKTGKSKKEYLGYYDTQEKAFGVYKYHKEKNIKIVADYYKTKIPKILYDALYNYEVEITD